MNLQTAISEWKAWLPQSGLADGAADRLLAGAVEGWSAKWFAGGPVQPLGPLAAEEGLTAVGADWLVLDDGIGIGVSEPARTGLAGLMLDTRIDQAGLAAADRQLIERLADGCIEDLCRRVTETFRLPRESRWRAARDGAPAFVGAWSCCLGIEAGKPLVEMLVDAEMMVAITKAGIPFVQKPIRLRPLAEGLARQPIAVSALLGRCQLSLSDLASLGEGDVVVLDRDLEVPLQLAVQGEPKAARCAVEQSGDLLCLKILEPIGDK